MAINPRALMFLSLACAIMTVALTQSNKCCNDFQSETGVPTFTGNPLDYRKSLDGTVITEGTISVGYTSPRCGSCAYALYTLKSNTCTYSGSLPAIRSFKCSYYLNYVSSGFTGKKEMRRNQPCYYSSEVSTPLNATHFQQCFVSYIGVASSEFSLSGPSSVATVSCQGLVAFPVSGCTINVRPPFP